MRKNKKTKLQSQKKNYFDDDQAPLSGDDKTREMTLSKLRTNQKRYFSIFQKKYN